MPISGFVSINCRTDTYENIYRLWDDNRLEMHKRGITTFSGFLIMLVYSGAAAEGLETPARSGAYSEKRKSVQF